MEKHWASIHPPTGSLLMLSTLKELLKEELLSLLYYELKDLFTLFLMVYIRGDECIELQVYRRVRKGRNHW
jgi:hypothetical protein